MVSREGWGAAPPNSALIPWNPKDLDGIVFHWFGVPGAASTHAGCDDLLRSVQSTHKGDGYIDIAYNIGVCPHGEQYELRGYWRKSGANGTTDANNRFLSIVYMAGTGDGLTEAGKKGLRAAAQKGFKLGIKEEAKLHQNFVQTGCPGPAVTRWVRSGGWKMPKVTRWTINYATPEKDADGNWKRADDKTQHVSTWFTRHPGALQRSVVHVRPIRD